MYVESRFTYSEAVFEVVERFQDEMDILPSYKVSPVGDTIGGEGVENFTFNKRYSEIELEYADFFVAKKRGNTGASKKLNVAATNVNIPPGVRKKRVGAKEDSEYTPRVTRSQE